MKASKGIHIIGIEDLPPGAIAAAALIRPEDMSLLTRDAALNLAGPFTHEAIESWSLADLGIIEGAMGAASSLVGVNQGISAMSRGLTEDMTRRMRDLIVVPHVDLMTQGMKSALNLAATYSVAADWQRRSFHVERSLPWVNSENIAYLEKWGGRLIGNSHNSLGTSSSWPSNSEDWIEGNVYDVSADVLCIQQFGMVNGSIEQLGGLFEHFFGPLRSNARYFITRSRQRGRWYIHCTGHHDHNSRERAISEAQLVGYIDVIDLPVALVEVFAYKNKEQQSAIPFIDNIRKRMSEHGFKIKLSSQRPTGMWIGTEVKLDQLRKLRNNSRYKGKINIGRLAASQQVGIDIKTFKRNAPELYEKWEDWEY